MYLNFHQICTVYEPHHYNNILHSIYLSTTEGNSMTFLLHIAYRFIVTSSKIQTRTGNTSPIKKYRLTLTPGGFS